MCESNSPLPIFSNRKYTLRVVAPSLGSAPRPWSSPISGASSTRRSQRSTGPPSSTKRYSTPSPQHFSSAQLLLSSLISQVLDATLKEVTSALLESDVNVKLVASLRQKVKAKVKAVLEGGGDKGKDVNKKNMLQKVRWYSDFLVT